MYGAGALYIRGRGWGGGGGKDQVSTRLDLIIVSAFGVVC